MPTIERVLAACCVALLAAAGPAHAGEADVTAVDISPRADGTYRFDVTVRHADTGWDHYADRWEVVGEDGAVLATRVLAHPHVDEQPFTRSRDGVTVPPGLRTVTVRAHDSVHGFGGRAMTVVLPDR
nr:hypothetical protein [Nitratireductor sp. StC3]